jgi:nucleoside-diphosphate-sugar epimerase
MTITLTPRTYGPRMNPDDGRVVSNFIIQALKGVPLTVYGEGKQTRSFQYVSDLVQGLVSLMNSDLQCTPVNLDNPTTEDTRSPTPGDVHTACGRTQAKIPVKKREVKLASIGLTDKQKRMHSR